MPLGISVFYERPELNSSESHSPTYVRYRDSTAGLIYSYDSRSLVVLYSDIGQLLHRKPRCLPNQDKNDYTDN